MVKELIGARKALKAKRKKEEATEIEDIHKKVSYRD
jgi:hypothetical protein